MRWRGLGSTLLAAGALLEPPRALAELFSLSLVEGFANPEDVELVPARRVLLVSEMGADAPNGGGALSAVVWTPEAGLVGEPRKLWPSERAMPPAPSAGDPECVSPPDPQTFSGHGLAVIRSTPELSLVGVVGHGAREALELFELFEEGPDVRARWVGCVPLPTDSAANDLAPGPRSLFVTNYIPTVHGLRALFWLQVASFGWNTGKVLEWRPKRGWRSLPGTEGPLPNGIAVVDGDLYVAYNGAARVVRRSIEGAAPTQDFALPGNPDNLSVSPSGAILVALLDPETPGAWAIASLQPKAGTVEVIFRHHGRDLPAVTSVVTDGSRYYLGSMASDAIGVLEAVEFVDP